MIQQKQCLWETYWLTYLYQKRKIKNNELITQHKKLKAWYKHLRTKERKKQKKEYNEQKTSMQHTGPIKYSWLFKKNKNQYPAWLMKKKRRYK